MKKLSSKGTRGIYRQPLFDSLDGTGFPLLDWHLSPCGTSP